MTKRKKRITPGRSVGLTIVGLLALAALIATLLQGRDIALMSPKGVVATEQRRLLTFVVLILLDIAIPSLLTFYFVAWKYRETNKKATYNPHTGHGKFFVFSIWAIPGFFALMIMLLLWPATHRLEPQKALATDVKPLTIQVIAMRWKWLFIYPEQNIASVNFVQLPVNTPVQFELSADEAPMSSFWIPHLGGQLYAMTGHVNRLNLLADTAGDFTGSSAEINGAGFAGMRFTTRAGSAADFQHWVEGVRRSPNILNKVTYDELLAPSQNNPSVTYAKTDSNLYTAVLAKYAGSHGHHTEHE